MKLIVALMVLVIAIINSNVDTAQWNPNSGGDSTQSTKQLTTLNRLFSPKAIDHMFTVDRLEEQIASDAGYVQDAVLGKIALRYKDLPGCPFLTPIYKLSQPISTNHLLMVTMDSVNAFIANPNSSHWQFEGIIGYGVLHQGECGATAKVRHYEFVNEERQDSSTNVHMMVTNDTEATELSTRLIMKMTRSPLSAFYIWE